MTVERLPSLPNGLFLTFYRPTIHSLHQAQFQHLQNAIGEVVAPKIRTAVLVAGFNIDFVGHPPVLHLEGAGGNIHGAATAVDNEGLQPLIFGNGAVFYHLADGVVENGNTFVNHVPLFDVVFRQNFPKEPLEFMFLLHRAGKMDILHPILNAVFQGVNDVQKELPQNVLAFHTDPATVFVQ